MVAADVGADVDADDVAFLQFYLTTGYAVDDLVVYLDTCACGKAAEAAVVIEEAGYCTVLLDRSAHNVVQLDGGDTRLDSLACGVKRSGGYQTGSTHQHDLP